MTARTGACPQCGTARQGDLRFCASCGFDYWKAAEADNAGAAPTSQAEPPSQATDPEADEKKNRRIGCIGIAVVAVLLIGIIGALNQDDDTPAAGASQTPDATPSAADESTPEPTGTPEPPADPTPTTESTPTEELTPSPEPTPEFAAIELTGTGSGVPRFDIPADSAAIAEISHTGGSNFAVWAIDGSGSQTDLLVNTIGNYTGTVLFDEDLGSHTDAFEVEADGSWTITIRPVTEAFRWDGTETLSGTGDDVVVLDPPSSGLSSTTLTHAGGGNFAIWGYSSDGTDLLVNEIGNYSGEVLLADGTFVLEITADGPWTASPPD